MTESAKDSDIKNSHFPAHPGTSRIWEHSPSVAGSFVSADYTYPGINACHQKMRFKLWSPCIWRRVDMYLSFFEFFYLEADRERIILVSFLGKSGTNGARSLFGLKLTINKKLIMFDIDIFFTNWKVNFRSERKISHSKKIFGFGFLVYASTESLKAFVLAHLAKEPDQLEDPHWLGLRLLKTHGKWKLGAVMQ